MTYFKSEKNDDTNSKDIFANIFVILSVICRICKAFFISNNVLHKHLRNARCNTHHKADFSNIDVNHVNVKKSVSEHKSINQLDKSTIQVAKLTIVSFKIDSNKNIEIEYKFRNWQYVIAQLSLTEDASNTSKCIDSEVEITLANTQFFKAQIKNFVSIRIMIILITVRSLEANRHSSDKYVIVSMYFKSKNVHENAMRAMITREVHLIDELKINILIDNDILDSKLFDISMFNKSTYIESCDVTISITIANSRYQTKLIHCIKIELISAHTEKLISIYKIFLANQNYFFESANSINFFIYAYLIDIKTNFISIRNDNNKALRISKNFKLSKIVESEYVNAFQVDTTVSELAIRSSKSDYQSTWFNKMLAAMANAHTVIVFDSTDTILFNEITVHISSTQAINAFTNLINNYSIIWTNQRFVKLSENNWMKLSLKTNWENNVKEKVRVYSLDARDKKVIDDTFDELQNQDKLAYITESTFFSFSCFVVWKKSSDKKKNKVVVHIRELNVISQLDVYFILLQVDVLQAMLFFIFFISSLSVYNRNDYDTV